MVHCFDPEIAKRYGVNAAVIFQSICYWCEHNRANERNFHNGLYWTYNSAKAFSELFPYLTAKQVRKAIQVLVDDGMLVTGNYNTSTYDRTLWYAVTEKASDMLRNGKMEEAEKGKSIFPTGKMEVTPGENGFSPEVTPIPINNTINTTDNNQLKDIYIPDKKKKHGTYQNVLLTDTEYQRLCDDYGADDTEKAIDYLDAYIAEIGYKSKSHNLTIRRWVYKAIKKNSTRTSGYDWRSL